MDSILLSIKKMIGVSEEQDNFDPDLIMHINTVFSVLNQLGVGPPDGFSIIDKDQTWNDFISNMKKLELIKTYMYLKVRLVFDPPTSSALIESIKENIRELEFRILVSDKNESRD